MQNSDRTQSNQRKLNKNTKLAQESQTTKGNWDEH